MVVRLFDSLHCIFKSLVSETSKAKDPINQFNMSKLFFLVGLTILAVAAARVPRDTAATPEFNADAVFGAIQTGLNNLGKAFFEATGAKDADDFQKKAAERFAAAQERMKVWIEGAQKDTEHLKETPVIKDLRTALEKLGNDFKAAHPGLTQEVSEQLNKVNAGVEDVAKKIKALENSEESKKFKETADKLIESAKQQLETLAKEMKPKA
ncbi:uncharacterized protein LOC133328171 [Musca vetustissima]|uniref:uncharacterized protein LOC133328171 n=1 Tax=Musca vetustissima TaxID=27455 RepID=UPI002AB7D18F|nr:uncharacterized protein LOC133328171 [Musca vetustissima]